MRLDSATIPELLNKLDPNSGAEGWISFTYESGLLVNGQMERIFNYGRALGVTIQTYKTGWIYKTVSVRMEGQMSSLCKVLLQVNIIINGG